MISTENQAAGGGPAGRGTGTARRAMIDSQLRTSGVNEPWVLAAMARVAREDFVPAISRNAAYIDRAIPLGNGRFLAAPLVHARMLAEAAPVPDDSVLLIGDGDGYLAALLRPLVASLDAVSAADAAQAKRRKAGYTLIVIDGAIELLPPGIAAQLADAGRLITGLVERGVTRLAAGRKSAGDVALLPLAELGIPILPELAGSRRWTF